MSSTIYLGTSLVNFGLPEVKERAERNSSFFSGLFAKATQLKMHLTLS
jgi:hypothetical protein